MKRVYLIHRWDGQPQSDWYPWLKKELESRSIEVIVPAMPESETPMIEKWVDHLKSIVLPDQNAFFVGHSIGCQAIMRYLCANPGHKFGGAVFVAGWFYLNNLESQEIENIAKPWLETPIDLAAVRSSLKYLNVILSSNDPYNCLRDNKSQFELGLKVDGIKIIDGMGHFTEDDGVTEIASILESLSKMMD